MGKKIWFSKPLAKQWEDYSKAYKECKISKEDFARAMCSKPSISWKKSQLNNFIWSLWYSDTTQDFLHLYFMDAQLKKELENIPLVDLDGIIKYINDNGFISKQGILELKYFPFGIHIPYENKYKAYAFGLMIDQTNALCLTWAVENGGAWFSDNDYKKLSKVKKEDKDINEMLKAFRFAINTIAYIEAFPDCIKEGVPPLVKDEVNNNSFIVEVSEKVINRSTSQEQDKKIISPHNRRAYFKTLTSDFYTHKKGRIIYVSETMVKGKAKTVYMSEELKGIDKLS